MHHPRIWAVVPAAGSGNRFGGPVPKQYSKIHGTTVIEFTLRKLVACTRVTGLVVALSEHDQRWGQLDLSFEKPVRLAKGGATRAESVLNAINAVSNEISAEDWILVHDAARPCVRINDIDRLIDSVLLHECGGILATPVKDTIKRHQGEGGSIKATVDRSTLWSALTPQLFKASLLSEALRRGMAYPEKITDESSAMELLGYHPRIVEARSDNLKITRAEDLAIAECILEAEAREGNPAWV